MSLLSFTSFSRPIHRSSNPSPTLPEPTSPQFLRLRCPNLFLVTASFHFHLNQTPPSRSHSHPHSHSHSHSVERLKPPERPLDLVRTIAASTLLFIGLSLSAACTRVPPVIAAGCSSAVQQEPVQGDINHKQRECEFHLMSGNGDVGKSETGGSLENGELRAAFEHWKSKTYALTVPLRIVALRSSVPPLWIKSFVQSQGRRVKLRLESRGSLEDIFSELSTAFARSDVAPKSAVAADLVTIGDSWLNFAITKALIEPIQGVEDQDWFHGLSDQWKAYLCRNSKGEVDAEGKIWAAPYRWGSMVIAYKKRKFIKHNLAPIEDWADLWRPELAGKISMVNSPREVVGAVLKYMGASYNTNNIDSQVPGGRNAVQEKLALLQKQVRLFDSVQYLKAFGVGDAWVAVGWSSDLLPAAKRMSDVAVIVPKSGSSLWADLWAIPAASRIATERFGGRVRGPSPLVHQWIEFCLQAERSLPFEQEVMSGASPSALERAPVKMSDEFRKNKPKLETNLVAGVPPTEILSKCEFLVPLSDTALLDYQWLIASIQRPRPGLVHRGGQYISSAFQTLRMKLLSKVV
ncbi:hypothetical protein RJ640_028934 [Escallonia rubra]|uniref:Uncharacterized protein n=1 Tax=Escallonia rubra TaxID=112253 RepID=A0AA88QP88_9ASTE|nr:hypothetical protein RJ640_028934 [Escallonia rubra]